MNIILSDGTLYSLNTSVPFIREHFSNPINHAITILNQINEGLYTDFIDEEDKVIVDCGANIGLFSIYASGMAEQVVSVEPTPSHFNILQELTKDFENISPINCAIGANMGKIKFYFSNSNTTMNSLIQRDGEEIEVDCFDLKGIVSEFNLDKIDFLKIDIEGSEKYFLNENNLLYLQNKVKKFFIEFHEVDGKSYSQIREEFIPIFSSLGFDVNKISVDALFCKKYK